MFIGTQHRHGERHDAAAQLDGPGRRRRSWRGDPVGLARRRR